VTENDVALNTLEVWEGNVWKTQQMKGARYGHAMVQLSCPFA